MAVPAHAGSGHRLQKTGVVNWDPVDQTVLANEQVIDGRGWRTGALVEKREIPMYYLRITEYAEELLSALDGLTGWPERVRTMQANWIGRSEGVRRRVPVRGGHAGGAGAQRRARRRARRRAAVFTTRADTLFGVTFVAVSAEHPLATAAAARNPQLAAFVDECRRGSTMEADVATAEKRGMPTGLHVHHPFTGEPSRGVGRQLRADGLRRRRGHGRAGARRARLRVRAKHGLAVRTVVRSANGATTRSLRRGGRLRRVRRHGELRRIQRARLQPRPSMRSRRRSSGRGLGRKRVQWRLRDWGISRQRYWGCPIPLVHCAKCGEVPVPDEQLPVRVAGRPGARRFRQSAEQVPGVPALPLPEVRRARRAAKPTPWTPSSIRRGISCATPAPTARPPRSTRARTTGCRWTSTSAASNTPSCICCIRASGPARCAI